MKNIKSIENLKNRRVLLRVDFNGPIKNGQVLETYRVDKVLPTIKFLRDKGAKAILLSHLEGKNQDVLSLRPVFNYLRNYFSDISFILDFSELEKISNSLKSGDLILFENLRFNDGEKKNDETFARRLASLGDIYVNEAFSTSHRNHASIVGLPKLLPAFAGPLFLEEVRNLSAAFSPERPFLFILGGAKTETKLPLLKKFSNLADRVFVGGILANDLFRAKGWPVGRSTVSGSDQDYSGILENLKIILPEKVIVSSDGEAPAEKSPDNLAAGDSIKDVVAKDFEKLINAVNQSRFILWNGPMGDLESGFKNGTKDLAKILIEGPAKTIIGGGDTVSVLDDVILEKFGFVSTGGGAMLDFLAKETLPGIEALELANSD